MRIDLKRCMRKSGFSLIEVAVVLVIISILLVIVASPLAAQLEARRTEDARRQLEAINEALIGFAMANGRLPCPARFLSEASNSRGQESFCIAASGSCVGAETIVKQTHGNCSNFSGFVPAAALGIAPIDELGFAVDAWQLSQNRIRYAVMKIESASGTGCPTSPLIAHPFTKAGGIKEAGMNCLANYNSDTATPPKTLITVCSNTPVAAQPYCTATKLTITAPFIVMSLGKNAATGGLATTDEGFNAGTRGDGTVFVSRTPTAVGSPVGEFDDIVTWTSLNTLFARMVQAGKLP